MTKKKKIKCPCRFARKHDDKYIRCVRDKSLRRPSKGCSRCAFRDDRSLIERIIDHFRRRK